MASNEHCFILIAIDYFTKWVEVTSYASVTKNVVVKFIKWDLICQYSLLSHIITDNRTNLNNKMMEGLAANSRFNTTTPHNIVPRQMGQWRVNLYSLVYGMEVVLQVKVEIPSLRVLTKITLDEAEWIQAYYDQLNLIEEKRFPTLCHGQLYQKRMKRTFHKKVYPREFHKGDLVVEKILLV
ncbi:hypothetical protein CR513_20016, partial [Mucuna pruriens]